MASASTSTIIVGGATPVQPGMVTASRSASGGEIRHSLAK